MIGLVRLNRNCWANPHNPDFPKLFWANRGKAYQNLYNARIRKVCLDAYGGKCSCCGEETFEFLAIDHKDGNGKEMRKVHGGGRGYYLWLKRNHFPAGFQVLCHNCNMAAGFYGRCPHENHRK